MACDRVVSDLMLPLWEEVLWPFLDSWGSVRLRTTSEQWNFPSGEGANSPRGAESAGAQHPAAWRASPPSDAEEADLYASQRGLQLLHRGWFLVPELKAGSEASKDEQAESSNENNVGNGALFVRRDCPFLARLGGGKGSPELPYCMRYAMPRVA